MNFLPWPSIVNFHTTRHNVWHDLDILNNTPSVEYKSKIKLHGSNVAIHISDGKVQAQSRTQLITPQKDNAGSAAFIEKYQSLWALISKPEIEYVVFGEWCGKGVNQGCAIHKVEERIIAIFAVVVLHFNSDKKDFIFEPTEIRQIIPEIPNVYILPWHDKGKITKINWLDSAEDLSVIAEEINKDVLEVENCDPWVKDIFSLEGIGEGLVYYPIHSHSGWNYFSNLGFKAKGEKHTMITKKPAEVNVPRASDIDTFVKLVVTEERLNQGARAINDDEKLIFDVKLTGKFLEWIAKDVLKETQAELEASKLEWKNVSKPISIFARQWYIKNTMNQGK